ncbi:thyroid adenoma-associated protein homolog [Camellia sinensis]|uniref:Uncharacterized protein n=1 Tax=Camellia sinensis var. sinensis TaxID=542762 RepID=A0A4S4DPY4_CAMSN|nr:thyroid adenoma-associated protein homolog [Camellia sinensis]THG05055.1 hypothetical protein TEA_012861 [Camellia sinensis var. sinensis]
MSAKWRALQHRHRYTYSAIIFPQSYIDSLNQLPVDTLSPKFFSELKQLVSLNSIYAQVNHVKKLASAFGDLLGQNREDLVSDSAPFYLEILFLENSLPLHRTLVSVLAKSRNFQSSISNCFRLLCDEYGGVNGKGKRFCVSRVALSMMSSPKLGYLVEIIEECAILVALDIVSGLNSVVSVTNDWSRPSPIVMEQCQEALSCMYYLLQRFPLKFNGLIASQSDLVPQDSDILEMILMSILSILKSPAFSRDCFVAAGVSFCAALQVCLSPEELGLAIMEGVFFRTNCVRVGSPHNEFKDAIFKVPFKGDLYCEIRNFSVLSRLCLIRGILTAVSRTVLNTQFVVSGYDISGFHANGDIINPVQTILYDGILPELCKYCENPTDSHFNFHALTVMQICLQQIKTLIQANVGNPTEDYDPISEDMGTRILSIIWNNLEDPLSQTVKQVHLIFDLFLDIQSTLRWSEGSERIKLSLQKITSNLLRLGPRCKGRYVPLASLTKRLGAKAILDMSSDLLFEATHAYIDDDVCCAVTTFLKCFLECLRDECWSSDGVESGYAKYRGHCLPPFLFGLASGVSKLRSNLNTYALPLLLELDVDAIFSMLAFISVGQGEVEIELVYPELSSIYMPLRVEQQVAILVSLIKVSRFLALIEGDIDWCDNSLVSQEGGSLRAGKIDCYAVFCIKGIKVKVLAEWLVLALIHVDESLRIDAAESLFLNPKTSSLPSRLELSLMKEAVPLNMRCCSTAFQMKWSSLFRKFFSRVRTALERQIKQGGWQPFADCDSKEVSPCKGTEEGAVNKAEDLFYFMKWMSSFLFFSCYPSAPYERKIMAMELMLIMINVWSIVPPSQGERDSASYEPSLCPYNQGLTSPDSTLLLVGSVIDSWDRLRESSYRILLHFPTPLPGICSQDMVQKVITWAKQLVCSPRVRESDAGALTLRLIFRKYVLELGWMVKPSCNVVSFYSHELSNGDLQNCNTSSPAVEYVRSLIDWLHVAVEEGEKDLSDACKKSFIHGVLLTLRYTVEELDWNSNVVLSSLSEMRLTLEKLLELVMRITSLALWVVSADAWYLPEDMDGMIDDDAFLSEVSAEIDVSVSVSEHDVKNSRVVRDVQPSEQIVMVGCWLAMKEVSLLLGTIIRKIPLPTSDSSKFGDPFSDATSAPSMASDVVLDLKQLETIGNHFLEVLLKMKHNGAIDKTRAGFTALCNRLLCSNDPRLCKLTESWMEQLMERTVAKGQTVDDLLRRSAGIPAAFTALFLSEPEGTPKRLLPRALRWLIDVANRSLLDPTDVNTPNNDSCNSLSINSNQPTASPVSLEMDISGRTSKIRDEGVVPTVHAFNVLRVAFNDTNLATDVSGFSAEALIISIRSFSSSYWEIRNSACLAYTALVRRMIGFLNVQKRESARRSLTGLEIFHRYPTLHPFLYNELRVATEFLNDRPPQHPESNLARVVHPSLCPMLILLSRLKPSTVASETGDTLDPFLFMPFIRRCSIQSNHRVRVLASRALTGLVSNEKLPTVLLNIASELPCRESQMMSTSDPSIPVSMNDEKNNFSCNSIHGMLLQLSSLLENNCRNLTDFSKKDQIIGDLFQVLVMCSWIGRPRLCPCPTINCCFLRVLDNMLGIARTCHISKNIGPIWDLLWELSSECLDVEATHGQLCYDPTTVELRKQAAISYFNCVSQASKEVAEEDFLMPHKCSPPASHLAVIPEMENACFSFLQRLVRAMSDASYEVRIATLKWLLLFLKATEPGMEASDQSKSEISIAHWIKTNLQAALMKILVAEKNHKCTYYILKILFTWNLLQFQKPVSQQCAETVYLGDMDFDSVLQFWDKLVSLYKHTRHAKTQEILICCMGICVKCFADLFTSSVISNLEMRTTAEPGKYDQFERLAHIYDCIVFYVNLIEQHSASSETINKRKSAAESLVASGLLEQAELIGYFVSNIQIPSENPSSVFEPRDAVNMYAHKILDIWFTCIKLLEDEDEELRRRLAIDVQKCFTSKRPRENSQTAVVPSQVEKVIELSFEHLFSIFGNWLKYFNYLSQWVINVANYVISTGDLVRRVFDKEIDNHHEEKLLICQICCSHLEKLPISKSWAVDFSDKQGVSNFLHTWRTRFYHHLISFANDHKGKHEGVDWIGSVGNHKDAFLPLYANLLGFYALSKCVFIRESESGNSLLFDVVELGEAINPFMRNPLISNLYFLVVRLHEKMVCASCHLIDKSRGDGSTWDGFDPYFLLR